MDGRRPGGCFSPDQKSGSGKTILRFEIRSSQIIVWHGEGYVKQQQESSSRLPLIRDAASIRNITSFDEPPQRSDEERALCLFQILSVDNFEWRAVWVRRLRTAESLISLQTKPLNGDLGAFYSH